MKLLHVRLISCHQVSLVTKCFICRVHPESARIKSKTTQRFLSSSNNNNRKSAVKMVEPSTMTESVPTGTTKASVSTWIEMLKIPTIRQGKLFEDEKRYLVECEWGVDELASKKSARFLKHYLIQKPSNGCLATLLCNPKDFVIDTTPTPVSSKLTCYSPSGKRKAVVVEVGKGDELHDNLQIWNNDTLEKTYDLKELDSHKSIYATGAWGTTMAWSPDESKLVYLAEKKPPKSEPFFTSAARRKLDDPDGEDSLPRGHDYDLRQNWGEQLDNAYDTVIVVLQPETDVFRYFTTPNGDFAFDLQWAGNGSIVGVALTNSDWRLGVIYCTNRESRVFQCDEHGFRYLSASGRSAMSPRVFPKGDLLIWQDRDVLGPHNGARRILARKIFPTSTDPEYDGIPNGPKTVFGPDGDDNVPAVYDCFPTVCFSTDGNSLYFLTSLGARNSLLQLRRNGHELSIDRLSAGPTHIQFILDVGSDFLLAACSSSTKTPSLELIDLSTGNFNQVELKEPLPIHVPEPVQSFIALESGPKADVPPSVLIEPSSRSSYPVIVIPHGGPHGVLVDSFDHETAYFTKLGFAVLKVNYVGSTGTWRDTTTDLIGKVGQLEVAQVHQIVQETLKNHHKIDSKHVFLCGGSHGGFIVTHLSSQYPGFYKAVVARNPVIDLNVMMGTSDITDWVYVEGGVPFDKQKLLIPEVSTDGYADKLRKCSPINLAHQVECPTLLHLGTKDLRVPMSQGLAYYRALKSYGKDVEIAVYDDNHALATTPVRANGKIQIVEFFNKYADKPIFD